MVVVVVGARLSYSQGYRPRAVVLGLSSVNHSQPRLTGPSRNLLYYHIHDYYFAFIRAFVLFVFFIFLFFYGARARFCPGPVGPGWSYFFKYIFMTSGSFAMSVPVLGSCTG